MSVLHGFVLPKKRSIDTPIDVPPSGVYCVPSMYHTACSGLGCGSVYCALGPCPLGACSLVLKLDFEHAIKRALCILKISVKGILLGGCPLKNRKGEKFTQTRMEK